MARLRGIGQVEEKKHNLLIHAGPARTGTTYIFDIIATHPNKAFRDTVQPIKGWRYYDHSEKLYRTGEINWSKWLLRRAKCKEGELSQPTFRDIIQACLKYRSDTATHEECFAIMTAFFQTMHHDADWNTIFSPDLMNYYTLAPYLTTHKELEHDMTTRILTADELCDIVTETLDVAQAVYKDVLEGLRDFQHSDKIEFVVSLRDPVDTFVSWCILKLANNDQVTHLFRKNAVDVKMPAGFDIAESSIIDKCLTAFNSPDLLPQEDIKLTNQYLIEFLYIIRQYEQFMGLEKQFKDDPVVSVNFIDFNKLNNIKALSKAFSIFADIDVLKTSAVFGNATNSWNTGLFPDNLKHLILTEPDIQAGAKTKFANTDYSPALISAQALLTTIVDAGPECCSLTASEEFIQRHTADLDK